MILARGEISKERNIKDMSYCKGELLYELNNLEVFILVVNIFWGELSEVELSGSDFS